MLKLFKRRFGETSENQNKTENNWMNFRISKMPVPILILSHLNVVCSISVQFISYNIHCNDDRIIKIFDHVTKYASIFPFVFFAVFCIDKCKCFRIFNPNLLSLKLKVQTSNTSDKSQHIMPFKYPFYTNTHHTLLSLSLALFRALSLYIIAVRLTYKALQQNLNTLD